MDRRLLRITRVVRVTVPSVNSLPADTPHFWAGAYGAFGYREP